jgi:hypothetical protein
MALSLPFSVRGFFLNSGKTLVCSPSSGTPRYTLSDASVYALRSNELNNPNAAYIRGDKRAVFAIADATAVGYTPREQDLIEYNNSVYRVLDVSTGENFSQYKLTMRRV